MDRFFDRLGDLLRALVGPGSESNQHFDPADPDVRAALAELDEYLESGVHARTWDFSGQEEADRRAENSGDSPSGSGGRRGQQRGTEEAPGGSRERSGSRRSTGQPPAETLRKDYANLEVPFSAPLEEVRASYRRLIRRYHPDRFSADPEKLKVATEISMRLNESFQRIVQHERGRR